MMRTRGYKQPKRIIKKIQYYELTNSLSQFISILSTRFLSFFQLNHLLDSHHFYSELEALIQNVLVVVAFVVVIVLFFRNAITIQFSFFR